MQVVTIDDRDPRIVYSPSWEQKGSKLELDGTTMLSEVAGATAIFQFSGAYAISVWGTIGASGPPPQSSYTIDKGIPVNFTATLQAAAQHQSNFFVSSVSPGPHTLVITTLVDGAQYYLDYIQVTPPLPNANCPVFQALSSSSKSSIKPNSTSTALRSMIMPSQSESSTPSHGKMSITMGGILGITFGSAACAAVMVIVIYHLTIRRRQRKNEAYTGEPDFISASTSRWTSLPSASDATTPRPFPFMTGHGSENSTIPPPHYSKISR